MAGTVRPMDRIARMVVSTGWVSGSSLVVWTPSSGKRRAWVRKCRPVPAARLVVRIRRHRSLRVRAAHLPLLHQVLGTE